MHRHAAPLALLGLSTRLAAAEYLSIMQWNPHWECFVKNGASCGGPAVEFLNGKLGDEVMDFANVVMLEDKNYQPPSGWDRIQKICGQDYTDLFYNTARWQKGSGSGAGCLEGNDRPFVVQAFTPVGGGKPLVVVGAHFPHPQVQAYPALADAVNQAKGASGSDEVIFIADTNLNDGVTNEVIMQRIGASGSLAGTDLDQSTCCYDALNPNNRFPHGFAFDRIITSNVGTLTDSEVLFNPFPGWAESNSMHKPVIGNFERSGASLIDQSKRLKKRRRSLRASALQADGAGAADEAAMLQLPEAWEDDEEEEEDMLENRAEL